MRIALRCEAEILYIDENLCTGCGICVDACDNGAISIRGRAAVIDPMLCTSCGACADVCPTGAVVTPKTGSSLIPRGAPATPLEAVPRQVGAPVRTSRLDTVEKVLSGLLGFVGFALDLKRSIAGPSATSGAEVTTRARGTGQGQGCGGQGPGRGAQGLGRTRGGGAGQGRGSGGGHGRKNTWRRSIT